jgi:hypothetical protein
LEIGGNSRKETQKTQKIFDSVFALFAFFAAIPLSDSAAVSG